MSFRSASAGRVLIVGCLIGAVACTRRPVEPLRGTWPGATSRAFRAYRDPTTGAFVEPPPGTALPAVARAPATAPTALIEEAAPGGGRMIRLRGNFRSHVVGRTDTSGAAVSCTTTTTGQP